MTLVNRISDKSNMRITSINVFIEQLNGVLYTAKQKAERRAKRESGRMRRQANDAAEATGEPESRSRDNKRGVTDGEFNFRSCSPKDQARTKTARATAATAVDGDDDWRKMKIEPSGLNDFSQAQHSQTVTQRDIRQGRLTRANINQQQDVSATEVKTTSG